MASQLVEDLKLKIRSGNPITRLMLINSGVFLILSLFRILVFFTGNNSFVSFVANFFVENISLPLNFLELAHKPWTIVTYMFTHIELMHIFWNMITLYWFAQILADFTSSKKIIPLYILGGIAGAIISVLLINLIPGFQIYTTTVMIGASAGVTAIIIASATLVPNYKMSFLFIGEVRLLYVALFVLFIDVLSVTSYSNVGGNLAHLGGALMGFIFILQYKKGRDLSKGITTFFNWINNLFKTSPKSKMKVAYKRWVPDEEYNYNKVVTQKQIDEILDKISKSGYESLSKMEKDILFKASSKK